jgi:hypothetical protein
VVLAVSAVEAGAWVLLALAVAALAAALFTASRRPDGLRGLFAGADSEGLSAAEAADELRTLIAEARVLSDELADRFDGRAADMARLLREADLRVVRLEQVLRAEGVAPATLSARDRPPPIAPPPNYVDPVRPSPRPTSVVEPVHALSGDPMAGEIYRLSDEGLPPVEIASRLGQHTGKVELILALRRG